MGGGRYVDQKKSNPNQCEGMFFSSLGPEDISEGHQYFYMFFSGVLAKGAVVSGSHAVSDA